MQTNSSITAATSAATELDLPNPLNASTKRLSFTISSNGLDLPFCRNDAVKSQPVNAWNPGSALQTLGVRLVTMAETSMKRLELSELLPASIHSKASI